MPCYKITRDPRDGKWIEAHGTCFPPGGSLLQPHEGALFTRVDLAAVPEARLALSFPTHDNANDPSAGEKAALAGTSGVPGVGNEYVTDDDARNTNARTPTAHAASHQNGGGDEVSVAGLSGL